MMNMPMIAILARQPLANSAANFYLSNARSGESEYTAQSTPGESVRSSWMNGPMIAIMAKQPVANSAATLQLERAQRRVRASCLVDLGRRPSGRPGCPCR